MGDNVADIDYFGEYYMSEDDRTPEQIKELRERNEIQDTMILEIRDTVNQLFSGVYGYENQNGLWRDFESYKKHTNKELFEIKKEIKSIIPSIWKALGAVVAAMAGISSITAFFISIIDK